MEGLLLLLWKQEPPVELLLREREIKVEQLAR
jgi:hypothetical protein